MRRDRAAFWLCTWFGIGRMPFAPGTFGTLGALPFAWLLHVWCGAAGLLLGALLLLLVGSWASSLYMQKAGTDHDPGEIVIDEVAGVWLLLAFLPPSWGGYALGFLLFRLFDILKPWPVSLADRTVKGGFGVMLDDILAALYSPVLAVLAWLILNAAGYSLAIETLTGWIP